MNMEHLQLSVVSCLLLGLRTMVISHPAIDNQHYNDFMTKCSSPNCNTENSYMHQSPVTYDVYQTNDPNANYNYPYSFASVIPTFGDYPKLDQNDEPNLYKDNEQGTSIESEFLDGVYALMLDNMRESVESRIPSSDSRVRSVSDEDDARSRVALDKQPTNPEIFREIEAALIDILTGRREQRAKYATNHTTNYIAISGAQKLFPDNTAYLVRPQPVSYVQSIEQGGPFAEPTFYQGNYFIPSSALTQPVSPLHQELPATKYDHKTNTVSNRTDSGHNGKPQKHYPFNSAYYPQPAPMMPMPFMQTGQEANPAVPIFYPFNYAMLPSPYAMPLPHSPSTSGLPPTGYSSQDEASVYLQPVYTAAFPSRSPSIQVWPVGGQYRPLPDLVNATTPGSNSTENTKNLSPNTKKRPVETNLTKIHVDPVTEEKTGPRRSHGSIKAAIGRKGNESAMQRTKNRLLGKRAHD